MKRQATGRERILAIHISDKRHYPEYTQNFYKSITKDKQPNFLIEQMHMNRYITKKVTRMDNKLMKMSSTSPVITMMQT